MSSVRRTATHLVLDSGIPVMVGSRIVANITGVSTHSMCEAVARVGSRTLLLLEGVLILLKEGIFSEVLNERIL